MDTVVLMDSYPTPAPGATEPFIVANERQVALSYRIAPSDFERFGPFGDNEEPFGLLLFPWAVFHRLGPPNDEGLGAHPLAALGMKWYSVHEVLSSSFVFNQWKVASRHLVRRHFAITFQDSTFECVATDCVLAGVFGSGEIAGREAFTRFC